MEAWLFALSFIGLLGGISLLIFFKFHIGFAITFFFHGCLYVTVSVWESPLWKPFDGIDCVGGWDWMWGLWGLMFMFIIPLAFLTMFVYAQSREENYKIFGKEYTKEASIYLMLIAGNWMTFGVMEDFGCYIIWGLDKFAEYAAVIHQDRFFLGIPTLYYMIIPGIILQILSLFLIRRYRIAKGKSI